MVEEITRCTRCILPSNYPNIDFDEKGECRVCREFDEKYAKIDWKAREAKLHKILKRYRGKGEKYDVMVPFSGGKDSSVVAALLVEALGKDRVLGVLMPKGIQDDIDMAKLLVDHLGIKSFTVNIKA